MSTLFLALLACDPNKGLDTAEIAFGDLDGDGYSQADGDCNDHNGGVFPSAPELCDGLDNDCDEQVDEGHQNLWYIDLDGDGYGDPGTEVESCTEISGYIPTGRDCDDDDPSLNPAADEVCDGADQDCDGEVDEGVTQLFWADADADGYGDADAPRQACEQPPSHVDNDFDCDDSDPEVRPTAADLCNGVDDDCDGQLDEDPELWWYPDDDGDGWGAEGDPVAACEPPTGYAEGTEDCDDDSTELNPDTTWYADEDGDGFGGAALAQTSCEAPEGGLLDGSDCDDADPAVNPDASESCNEVDDDCDGTTDEDDAVDAPTWYADADGDGYGVATSTTLSCSQPSGYAPWDGDCDESDGAVNPGAVEICDNGVDDDCDGGGDETCPIDHCGSIAVDETWDSEALHTITCDLTVSAALTIEDGAVVVVDEGYGVTVGAGGSLFVEGSSAGVTMSSSEGSPKAGDWLGLSFDGADDSVLEGLTLEHGGGNGVGGVVVVDSEVELLWCVVRDNEYAGVAAESGGLIIQDSELSDNESYGLVLDADSTLDDVFSGNTVTGNDKALALPPNALGMLDPTSDLTGNTHDRVDVEGGTVSDDATWSDLGADYVIAGDIYIQDGVGADVNIADGSVWLFENATQLRVAVSSAGSLTVDGSTTGVTMASADANPQAGDWDGLYFGSHDTGSSITGLTLSEGGYGSVTSTACVYTLSDLSVSDSSLVDCQGNGLFSYGADIALTGTTVDGATLYGVQLYGGADFSSFSNNTLTNNGGWPLTLGADSLRHLDSATTLSGNGDDAVLVTGGSRASHSGTWPALSYRFTSSVNIGDNSLLPDITIEDGAVLAFDSGALYVGNGSYGTLTVAGSSSSGVVFTSSAANPAAGDWSGLYLGSYADGSSLAGFTVEYAGAANVAVYANGVSDLVLDDCLVTDGAGMGVYAVGSSTLTMTDCTVSDHATYGVRADNGELKGAFTGNTLTGNGLYPLLLHPDSLGMLDASSSFTGNATDRVAVDGGTVDASATWPLLDADYLVLGDVTINASAIPHVVIEAGTRWEFDNSASLRVHLGSLEAVGTSSDGIVLTADAASPSPGHWEGLTLGGNCVTTKTVLDYVTVSYGGGSASGHADAGIYWACDGGTLSNSTVSYSGAYGIYRWYASPTLTNISYAGNVGADLY